MNVNNNKNYLALMPECTDLTNTRARLLYLCNMLQRLTEPGHGLTIEQIRLLIEAKGQEKDPFFKAPSKNTIHDDLRALADNPHLNTVVHSPKQGETGGFWIESTLLDQVQICLLINIVQACTFINQNQCDALVENLKKMISAKAQYNIATKIFVDSRVKADSVDVFNALRTIAQALHENKKVQYRYTSYGLDGKKHYIDECADGSFICETPLDLVFSNSNYYVETWNSNAMQTHIPRRLRLDRIEDISVSSEPAERGNEIRALKSQKQIEARTRMSIDMLGSGQPCHLFLRVREETAANIILNKFGYDCILIEKTACAHANQVKTKDPDHNDISGIAFITVQLSPTFYRFLFGLGDMVKIVKPCYEWSDQTKWTKKRQQNVPYNQLLSDYNRAINGYKEHLRTVWNLYNE